MLVGEADRCMRSGRRCVAYDLGGDEAVFGSRVDPVDGKLWCSGRLDGLFAGRRKFGCGEKVEFGGVL